MVPNRATHHSYVINQKFHEARQLPWNIKLNLWLQRFFQIKLFSDKRSNCPEFSWHLPKKHFVLWADDNGCLVYLTVILMIVYGMLINHGPTTSQIPPANYQRPPHYQPTKRPPLTANPATNGTTTLVLPMTGAPTIFTPTNCSRTTKPANSFLATNKPSSHAGVFYWTQTTKKRFFSWKSYSIIFSIRFFTWLQGIL